MAATEKSRQGLSIRGGIILQLLFSSVSSGDSVAELSSEKDDDMEMTSWACGDSWSGPDRHDRFQYASIGTMFAGNADFYQFISWHRCVQWIVCIRKRCNA